MVRVGVEPDRVLILMPTVRDAQRTAALVQEARLRAFVCVGLPELCRELRVGADTVLITDETILGDSSGQLAEALRAQPAWSAIPVVVVAREGNTHHVQQTASAALGNVIVVERPVRTRSLLSLVRSALRTRRHQYQIRDAIVLREQQAAALSVQEERMRFVLSAGALGWWELDPESGDLATSPACKANFGRGPDDSLTYEELRASVHPEDRPRFAAAIERTISMGEDYDGEQRVVWPDGEVRWLLLRGRVAYDAANRPRRIAGVSLDITASKRMQEVLEASQKELARQAEQLRSADRRKDDFLATLAHELRNPLAPIQTGVDLLATQVSGPHVDKTLGVMNRQLCHMVRLIDDLLDISRITRSKLTLKRERIALATVVDAAVEASRPLVEDRRHTLRVTARGGDLQLDADLTRMAQVVGNLLSNAAKYTPPGGTIDLVTSRDGEHARIDVQDDGVGIPLHRLQDVFEMFSQVDPALERTQGGLGIGLALVRSFVELHGGSVQACSGGPGQGSTFTVRLPLAAALPAPQPSTPDDDAAAPPSPRRVLVVDDNRDAADLLCMILEQSGYATSIAYDSQSALAAVGPDSPDVVILDIGLPGKTGYEVARELRDRDRVTRLGLIALTGWGSMEDKQKAMNAGFDVHLTKPIDTQRLRSALAEVEHRRDGVGGHA